MEGWSDILAYTVGLSGYCQITAGNIFSSLSEIQNAATAPVLLKMRHSGFLFSSLIWSVVEMSLCHNGSSTLSPLRAVKIALLPVMTVKTIV